MDLNQLLHQHQRALMNADGAASLEDRQSYFDLVGYYASRIRKFRERLGLPRYHWPERQNPLAPRA
jgi:hypothetical protein